MRHARLLLSLLAAVTVVCSLYSQGPNWVYQGQLKDSTGFANGNFDFQFWLYDALTAGNIVAGPLAVNNVTVTKGTFTVELNFGAAPFMGAPRWLQLAVRPSGGGSYNIVAPRQPITAAPYSLYSAGPWQTVGNTVNYPGSVGIGTPSPIQTLDVNGRIHVGSGVIQRGGAALTATTDLGLYQQIASSWMRFVTNGGPFRWYSDSGIGTTPIMSLMANGFLGIGTGAASPLDKLHVDDTAPVRMLLRTTTANGFAGVRANNPQKEWFFGLDSAGNRWAVVDNSGGGTPRLSVEAGNGYVGVGIGLAAAAFRIDLPNLANADGRGRANQWTTYSSRDWKEEIHPIESAIAKVMQLEGVRFRWKQEYGGTLDLGFIIEEVEQVLPEIINYDENGKAVAIDYGRIVPVTVQAIKEQQRQIDLLRGQNAEMKGELERLYQLIEQLLETKARK
ncbi:MAG: tail fiber domain-containing protein [Armatimonadetes bacterium]|nr:tail fiber domain-containing protein [Armatimonadota bacterium]